MASTSTPTTSSAPPTLASSPYPRVEVLNIRWGSTEEHLIGDQMTIHQEFEEYGYATPVFDVAGLGHRGDGRHRDSRVLDAIMRWVEKFDVLSPDGKRTLLIVTYSGHGSRVSRDGGLPLLGASNTQPLEYFDLSWIQLQCRLKIQNSDLFWLNDCCFGSLKGYPDLYPGESSSDMQMEVLSSCHEVRDIVSIDVSLFPRLAQNMRKETGAVSVHQRFAEVYDEEEKDRAGEGVYRLDAGTLRNSIVLAPLRQADGSILKLEYNMMDYVIQIDEDASLTDAQWQEQMERSVSPPLRIDEERQRQAAEKAARADESADVSGDEIEDESEDE